MLDIRFIRENQDIVRMSNARRGVSVDLKKLIALDDERIATAQSDRTTEKYQKLMAQWRKVLISIPNILDVSVPDKERVVVETGTSTPQFSQTLFDPVANTLFVHAPNSSSMIDDLHRFAISAFSQDSLSVLYTPQKFSSLSQVDRARFISEIPLSIPGKTLVLDQYIPHREYVYVQEGQAVLMDSLAAFDHAAKSASSLVGGLFSQWTVYIPSAQDISPSSAKEYCWEVMQEGNPRIVARVSFERDYIARQAGRVYQSDGQKRYAHTVIAQVECTLLK